MEFKIGVINIQASCYNGAHAVYDKTVLNKIKNALKKGFHPIAMGAWMLYNKTVADLGFSQRNGCQHDM